MTGDCHVRFCERRGVRIPPATRLNQDVKRHLRALHPRPLSKPGLKDALTSFLENRRLTPQIVRNYFQAPDVQYAA
jgi:hypothetical protein